MKQPEVKYGVAEETIEAKTLWFKSLSIQERIEVICAFSELAYDLNPKLAERPNDQPTGRSIQILSRA